jgi:DNA-binding transcriptional LysR family regulator
MVRVSAGEIVGAEILPPLFAILRERHPELEIELVLSNEVDNLLRREADIAVRMGRPRAGGAGGQADRHRHGRIACASMLSRARWLATVSPGLIFR